MLGLLGKMVWISIVAAGGIVTLIAPPQAVAKRGKRMGILNTKSVLMIIAESNFRDEEFQVPKKLLEDEGLSVTVASTSLSTSRGILGMSVKPDVLLNQVKAEDYNAIVFVGGAGASQYWKDPVAHRLAQEVVRLRKIVSAICIAPVTLANAGLLSGKRATVFSSEVQQLRSAGAHYIGQDVVRDGNIITASGPQAAYQFGQALIQALSE